MKRITTVLALLLLAGGCASSPGPDGGQGLVASQLSLEPPPIYALLGYRTQLELSSEQVEALDSIGQWIQQEHRPLVRELQEASRERSRQPGLLDVNAETIDLYEEIRSLQREAAESVQGVLSEEQQEAVCRLFDGSGRPGGAARAQRGSGTPDMLASPRSWIWCTAEENAGV